MQLPGPSFCREMWDNFEVPKSPYKFKSLGNWWIFFVRQWRWQVVWSYQLGETPKAFCWRFLFHCWDPSLRTAMSLPTMGTTLANKWSSMAISATQTQQLTDGSVTWHQNGAFTIPKHSTSHFQVENAWPERDYWWKALPQWNQPLAQGRRPHAIL